MVYAYSSSISLIVLLISTLGTMMIVNVNAQSEFCSTYVDSCNGCLENSCAWVPVAGCIDSCDSIADVSCYSPEYFTESTTEEICSIATMEISNLNLCNSQTDCTTCIDTTFVDGGDGFTNTCQWFKNDGGIEGYCGSECGMMGCGELTCDAVAVAVDDNDNDQIMINECESNTSCRDCLSSTSTATTTCGWVNGMGCLESCNIIADVGCYDIENSNGNDVLMTGDDICTVAENDIANVELCDSQTDCTTCIETSLLVASSSWKPIAAATTKCKWFSDMNFCGSECNMIGCGESTCTTADNESPDLIMEGATTAPATTPSSSSVDAVKSSTAAKKKSNYFFVWTVTATATLMVAVASCLL